MRIMALRKGDNPSLQEIIDRYNREMLSYSQRAEQNRNAQSVAARPQTPPEPSAQHTPIQPRSVSIEEREPFPGQLPIRELSEQLLDQLRRMPRPLPQEYPETRDSAPANAQIDEEAAGRAEYLQGIRDLEQGLLDLAQGEKDLREGIEAYEQGIRERVRWRAQAVPAAAQQSKPDGFFEFDPDFVTNPDRVAAQDTGANGMGRQGFGRLRINTSAARQAIPIEGAYVQVIKRTLQGDSLVGAASTDVLGLTPFFELPVAISSDGGMTAPFEEYLVNVSAVGYRPIVGLVAQVFAGISGTLPVFLVPLSEEERL